MFVTINGDYSRLPGQIRDVFKLLDEHVTALYEGYQVYGILFMTSEKKTAALAQRIGSTLAWFQNFLQDGMCMQIAKLMDPPRNRSQENLSLRKLKDLGCPLTREPVAFEARATAALNDIEAAIRNITTHRHKRLGHFDLNVSLADSLVPRPVFQEIQEAVNMMGEFLNMFAAEFGHPVCLREFIRGEDITEQMEVTVRKAIAYDRLAAEGRIDSDEWADTTTDFHKS